MYHQIKGLARKYEICLIALSSHAISTEDKQKLDPYVSEMHIFQLQASERGMSMCKALFSSLPLSVAYHYSRRIHKEMKEIVARFTPDLIYYQLTRMCKYSFDQKIPKVLDYMDAFGVGMARRGQASQGVMRMVYREESRRMISYEKKVYPDFVSSTIISDQDRREIDIQDPRSITVNPNGVDTEYFIPTQDDDKKYDLGFVGNMGYLPNVEAAGYLVKEILPRLSGSPQILIAGARPTEAVKALGSEEVTVSGWLDDIRDAYRSSRIFVAPLFAGTGQQNKILEAMAMGIPCITTTVVNAAIGTVHGTHLWIADTPEEFEIGIERLLNDPQMAQDMSRAARAFVEKNYSWDSNVRILEGLFEALNKG